MIDNDETDTSARSPYPFFGSAYEGMSLEALAYARVTALNAVDELTAEMKLAVIKEKANGMNITKLAETAGVARPTIYKWLREK
jgi:DNA-binding phage protein